MAETKRMTAEQVVSFLLEEEGVDFLHESLRSVVQQLIEAEVTELIGAERGERSGERLTTATATGRGVGTRVPASSSWRSRRSAAAPTFRASSCRGGDRSRRWWR